MPTPHQLFEPDAAAPDRAPTSKGRRRRVRPAPAVEPDAASRVVSVLPAVAGIDRVFDYTVPPAMDGSVALGSVVRADLGGRRVAGWVVADRVEPPEGLKLRPLTKATGYGPPPDLVELSRWAAWRWAGRRSAFLASGSPEGAVAYLPAPDRRAPARPAEPGDLDALVAEAFSQPVSIVALPPAADVTPLVALVAQRGPTLVIVPSAARAAILADRLRRAGAGVAELPGGWPQARAGAGVVIGSRAAAWAPCPDLAAVVVIDAHDEALVQEQAPTWWATEVARERAARAGVPCVWVTPCPTLDLLAAGQLVSPSVGSARRGWAPVEVVDRRTDDPRLGLYSERLVRELRAAERAVCVLNRTGRVRVLACGACGELARCERCGAAVAQGEADPGTGVRPLVCPQCATIRPPVCLLCQSTRLRHLRIGVSRAREDLERLVGRPVGEITATSADRPDASVVVGTEAVFHRLANVDLVAFLDFDQELLAPRFRAGEEALALLARAARLVGGRRREGRVLVQARTVDHPALRAAVEADPTVLATEEEDLRRALGLPPARSLAAVTGPGAADLVAGVPTGGPVEVIGPTDDRWTLRAASVAELCDALAGLERPAERVRVEVDPLRV